MKILKVPFSEAGLGKTAGTEKAPDMIIEELQEMHLNESYRRQAYEISEVEIVGNNISENNRRIEEAVVKLTKKGDADGSDSYGSDAATCPADRSTDRSNKNNIPKIILGGDHSITYATLKGFAKSHPGCGLVLLDAHPDLLPEAGIQSHEDYLRLLINEGIITPDKVIIAGVRNTDNTEKEFIDSHNIKVFTMKHIFQTGLQDFCDGLMETARGWPGLYLSIDIDVADPGCAPGTGYLEPGGFSARELVYLVQRLSLLKNLQAVDIVEVNPDLDLNKMTIRLAAKLIKELE